MIVLLHDLDGCLLIIPVSEVYRVIKGYYNPGWRRIRACEDRLFPKIRTFFFFPSLTAVAAVVTRCASMTQRIAQQCLRASRVIKPNTVNSPKIHRTWTRKYSTASPQPSERQIDSSSAPPPPPSPTPPPPPQPKSRKVLPQGIPER